jgi:hypothetical protein
VAYSKKAKTYVIKRLLLIVIGIVCSGVIFYAGYLFYRNVSLEEKNNTLGSAIGEGSKGTMEVARAKHSMSQGELLDINKVEMIEVPSELSPKGAITSIAKLSGKRLKREVGEKELLNDMDLIAERYLLEEDARLMEHNFAEGAVPAAVAEGNYIDIKLFISGKKDCVVISKTLVISRNASLLSFYVNMEEQEFIKEAAGEGLLFAVKYIDTSQIASVVTYVPPYNKSEIK